MGSCPVMPSPRDHPRPCGANSSRKAALNLSPPQHRGRQSGEARYDPKENPQTHFIDDSLQPWLPLHADKNRPVQFWLLLGKLGVQGEGEDASNGAGKQANVGTAPDSDPLSAPGYMRTENGMTGPRAMCHAAELSCWGRIEVDKSCPPWI